MIKDEYEIIKKGKLNFLKVEGKETKFQPWAGNAVSFLYDKSMSASVIPRKFSASVERHGEIMRKLLLDAKGGTVLDIAAGSGSAAGFLPEIESYTAVDVSPGLLSIASKKLDRAGIKNDGLYVCGAEDLPFVENSFSLCLCVLSLNFFSGLEKSVDEAFRVLEPGGFYAGCVPVRTRMREGVQIRGRIETEESLQKIFEEAGFIFNPEASVNGAILYFKALKPRL